MSVNELAKYRDYTQNPAPAGWADVVGEIACFQQLQFLWRRKRA
jgi:hypothetical protein